jgi:DNA invertase Pin-like site-specific DNA recombinase
VSGDQLVITRSRPARALTRSSDRAVRATGVRGVDLVLLLRGIATSTAIGRLCSQIVGASAEFEDALMSEHDRRSHRRAHTGVEPAGRSRSSGLEQVNLARQMYGETGLDGKRRYTVTQIAVEFGVWRPTIYRHLEGP